jgi:acetyl esterase
MLQKFKVALLRRYYRALNWYAWRRVPPPPVTVRDRAVEGPAGAIPVRSYSGASQDAERVIVYFHGGGWVLGDLQTHDPFCRQLCHRTGSVVVAVDYRLAPEHPFPAAVEDCEAVTRWVQGNLDDLGAAGRPVLVAGDSAGGNLAAVTARNVAGLAGQILVYPVTSHYRDAPPSYAENAKGYGLTRNLMVWFWDTYLQGSVAARETSHPLAMPLGWEDFQGLPPAIVFTAGLDPLRDEGAHFADRLADAGIPCTHWPYPRAMRGFVCSEGQSEPHREAMEQIAQWVGTRTARTGSE